MAKKEAKGWELSHAVDLLDYQRHILKSLWNPPVDRDLKELSPEVRKLIRESSPLAESRCANGKWLKTNQVLYKKALEEDDNRAFHELISRDPRYLCSDLGLWFISRWRVALDVYHVSSRSEDAFRNFHRWLIEIKAPHPSAILENIEQTLEFEIRLSQEVTQNAQKARGNLNQISKDLAKPFDQRGFRSGPPKAKIKLWYLAAIILASGIKQNVKAFKISDRLMRAEELIRRISNIPDERIPSEAPENLLRYVKVIACLLASSPSLPPALRPSRLIHSSPSTTASVLVGALFGLSPRTVQDCAKWNLFMATPSMRLQDYPAAAELLRTK